MGMNENTNEKRKIVAFKPKDWSLIHEIKKYAVEHGKQLRDVYNEALLLYLNRQKEDRISLILEKLDALEAEIRQLKFLLSSQGLKVSLEPQKPAPLAKANENEEETLPSFLKGNPWVDILRQRTGET